MTEEQEVRAWSLLIAATAMKPKDDGGTPELKYHIESAKQIELVISEGWEIYKGKYPPNTNRP